MKKTLFTAAILLSVSSILMPLTMMFSGCEAGSADDVVRTVGVDFSGRYDATSEADAQFVSPANSGKRVTSLNLRQTGDQLEAIDNNSMVFSGSIGNVQETTASFILEGYTTANQPVSINGTLTGEGSTAVMAGTWVEPGLFAYINGDATINPIPTNTGVAISPSGTISLSVGGQQTINATGGSGTYSWSLGNGTIGTLNTTSGASVSYTATQTGTQTVTVNSGDSSASLTINQGSTSNSLTVSPSSTTLGTNGDTRQFTATGGSGSGYTWSILNGNVGKIDNPTANPVTYTRSTSGNNSITVTDSQGSSKTASITQP
jgi:hypothetical protein